MDSVINRIKQTSLSVAEQLTPVLKESRFREQGRLTPEEFVSKLHIFLCFDFSSSSNLSLKLAAGDHLTHFCPTWSWSAGDENKAKPYLLKDKQFLVTRNVPCQRRCRQMEFSGVERIVEDAEGDEGWVTHDNEGEEDDPYSNPSEMTLDTNKLDELRDKESQVANEDDDEGEAIDMEDFEESGQLENVDPSEAIIMPVEKNESTSAEADDSVVHTRTYDLHIVYNKYYQTPHLFLIGYDEKRRLLSVEQMFEDVSQDNAKKTVTMEQRKRMSYYF